jgi:membrane-bound lytic murein transglycosylase D
VNKILKFILIVGVMDGFIACSHAQSTAPEPSAVDAADTRYPAVSDEEVPDDTPVQFEEIAGNQSLTGKRPWRPPNYASQENSMGYSKEVFDIPKGLETNVKFWTDIYTKYTTDQGVLHDSEHIDLIYKEIDFRSISSRGDLDIYQKERAKIKILKEAKKQIISMLKKLEEIKDPSELNEEEKRIWEAFKNEETPKKFKVAQGKNRLRFQLGQRDRVIQGIFFSGRYLEEFETIFREQGIPIELTRIAFVESSFNVMARSKVGASGIWQIMPYTAKGFMKKDPAFDLRNHPIEATKLAAKLFRNNYNMLKAWPLAVTGYNHGPAGVLRLTKRYKTRELGELVENVSSSKSFGFASRNFYASFLAILKIEAEAPKYFGQVQWSELLNQVNLKTEFPIKYADLLRWFDGSDEKLQIYNPHINKIARTGKKDIPAGVVVSVMKDKEEIVKAELTDAQKIKEARNQQVSAPSINRTANSY